MNTAELKWRQVDESIELFHCPNQDELLLIYGRIYTSRMGFDYSETNQLIINFKKSPERSNDYELRYKRNAIAQFAREAAAFLERRHRHRRRHSPVTLIPMPPSKTRAHPEYDDRVEQVAQRIEKKLSNVRCCPLLQGIQDVDSYHTRSTPRDPNEIFSIIEVDDNEIFDCDDNEIIYVIDDILTSGAHFTAARRHILECYPDIEVRGLFWAKAQDPDDFNIF